jgi:hypothetical protein
VAVDNVAVDNVAIGNVAERVEEEGAHVGHQAPSARQDNLGAGLAKDEKECQVNIGTSPIGKKLNNYRKAYAMSSARFCTRLLCSAYMPSGDTRNSPS